MSDMIDAVASHLGISPQVAHQALGALLNFLKVELGSERFDQLAAAIPGSAGMLEASPAAAGAPASGGLLSTIAAAAGKLLGGKTGQGLDLVAVLSSLGLSVQQIEACLVKSVELFEAYVPPELLQQMTSSLSGLGSLSLIPGTQEATGESA